MNKTTHAHVSRATLLVALMLLPACSREPEAVKKAYELMSHRMCKESIPALKAALVERPDDPRIPRALCEVTLCALSEDGATGDLPSFTDRKTYCEQGFAGASDADGLVAKAFVLDKLNDSSLREASEAALGKAAAQFGSDRAVQWYAAYSFRDGEHRSTSAAADSGTAAKLVPLGEGALGEVRFQSEPCLATPDKAKKALVRRGGAGIFVPGSATPEARLDPGDSFEITGMANDRVRFVDSNHPHWMPGTGWIPFTSDFKTYTGTAWLTNFPSPYREVPLSPRFVMRTIPSVPYWSGVDATAGGKNCGWHNQSVVECLASRIPMRPGSLTYQAGADATQEQHHREISNTDYRNIYRRVAFEERDVPEREVLTTNVYLTTGACSQPHLQKLLHDYGEWHESIVEAALRGQVRQGMPALILKAVGWEPKELIFDRQGFVFVWHDSSARAREVRIRGGRVD